MNTTTRINLGSGGRAIGHGFSNYDAETNIFAPLRWANDSVEFIVCSHTMEHGTPAHGWGFIQECHRILRRGGVARITVPDAVKAYRNATDSYIQWIAKMGWGDGTRKGVLNNLLAQHGYLACWNTEMLIGMMEAAGFTAKQVGLHHSDYPELAGSSHHHLQIGMEYDAIESLCVEGIK